LGDNTLWPDLPYAAWSDTCDTLHRWVQIAGKIRMAFTPLVNHWWNVTLYVTPRGLTTSPIPCGTRTFSISFDFIDHTLRVETSDGATQGLPLRATPVCDFYRALMERLRALGIEARIWTMPCEIDTNVRFEDDRAHAHYDPVYVDRFRRVLQQSDRVMKAFRARFIGKVSPVHFFWGSFDLAVTRFSGRTAPPMERGAPNTAAWVMREAYSHEVSSCGFWPGNGGYGRAAFYSYAYPEPAGFKDRALRTLGAFYDQGLSQFILPYDAVRGATDPDAMLLGFFQETYEAAADLGKWDRQALERSP
jgi:Family of unknown function (DUF5996)